MLSVPQAISSMHFNFGVLQIIPGCFGIESDINKNTQIKWNILIRRLSDDIVFSQREF